MSMVNRALSEKEIKANYERDKKVIGKSHPVKLGIFLRQPSFVVDGVLIYRDEVIKYVSNKLGGAHYGLYSLPLVPCCTCWSGGKFPRNCTLGDCSRLSRGFACWLD